MTKTQINKMVEGLTDSELATLANEIEEKRKAAREALEKEQYEHLTKAANDMATALGWEKLLKIALIPDSEGKKYEISLGSLNAGGCSKRTKNDINSGDITIKKLGDVHGGKVKFRYNGAEYLKIQDLIKDLKQSDGKPESERCWDIQHKLGNDKGISASDIVIKYHADEVTLIYKDGNEQGVKEAIEKAKEARAST